MSSPTVSRFNSTNVTPFDSTVFPGDCAALIQLPASAGLRKIVGVSAAVDLVPGAGLTNAPYLMRLVGFLGVFNDALNGPMIDPLAPYYDVRLTAQVQDIFLDVTIQNNTPFLWTLPELGFLPVPEGVGCGLALGPMVDKTNGPANVSGIARITLYGYDDTDNTKNTGSIFPNRTGR